MTELIFAPGTSERLKKVAQTIPPYDLLKAFRDARAQFSSNDIVLAIASGADGFTAMTRATYIEKAFRRWSEAQRKLHPLVQNTAHKKVSLPVDSPAFWLVIEDPDSGEMGCCAIGAFSSEILN